jgi:hypothetical protein
MRWCSWDASARSRAFAARQPPRAESLPLGSVLRAARPQVPSGNADK